MDWLTLSLTAAALWGGSNVVDKVVVEKHLPNPWLCACFMAAYGLVSALVVGLMVPIRVESLGSTALTCLSGLLYLIYILLYFAALSRGDSVVVAALGQITPIFAALWDYLFLGQIFGMTTYLGVGVVVVGAMLISLECRQTVAKPVPRFNRALQLMVLACLVRSLSDLSLKYALTDLSGWDGFFWSRLGIFAGAAIIFVTGAAGSQQWVTTVKRMGWPVNGLIMGNEVICLVATLANTLAYVRGPLTLVAAAGSVQPLFILLFVAATNLFSRDLAPEQANWRLAALRLPSLGLIIFGAYLLGSS